MNCERPDPIKLAEHILVGSIAIEIDLCINETVAIVGFSIALVNDPPVLLCEAVATNHVPLGDREEAFANVLVMLVAGSQGLDSVFKLRIISL
jgi:hypothetical protein